MRVFNHQKLGKTHGYHGFLKTKIPFTRLLSLLMHGLVPKQFSSEVGEHPSDSTTSASFRGVRQQPVLQTTLYIYRIL